MAATLVPLGHLRAGILRLNPFVWMRLFAMSPAAPNSMAAPSTWPMTHFTSSP